MNLQETLSSLNSLNNLTGTFNELQINQLADLLMARYHWLTPVQLEAACNNTLGMEGRVTSQKVIQSVDRVVNQIRMANEERKSQKQMESYQRDHDRYMSPEEFVSSGTQQRVHEALNALTAKYTKWKQDNRTVHEVRTLEKTELEKRQSELVTEWNRERVKWAGETGKRIQDYPTTMEQYVNDKL